MAINHGNSYIDYSMGMTIQGLNSAGAKNVSVLDNYQTSSGAPVQWVPGFSPGRGVTGPAHIVIEWSCVVWAETALP